MRPTARWSGPCIACFTGTTPRTPPEPTDDAPRLAGARLPLSDRHRRRGVGLRDRDGLGAAALPPFAGGGPEAGRAALERRGDREAAPREPVACVRGPRDRRGDRHGAGP